ncbi:MAG TPA: zinc ribbon domain-containing protein, partial [Labilithrix sp.]|nr:zinc ribbon domain-containing protein [Labilithrix sp.]
NERALGKLEADDHEQLSTTYRAELKEIMRRIDASLEPHRPKAESAVHAYMLQAGLVDGGYRGAPPPSKESAPAVDEDDDDDDDDDDEESEEDVVEESETAKKKRFEAFVDEGVAFTKAEAAKIAKAAGDAKEPARVTCPSCAVSNEPDAAFCKKCGTSLAAKAVATAKESADEA